VTVSEQVRVTICAADREGIRDIQVSAPGSDPDAALLAAGSTPLPPYIRAWVGDSERYQTIFADIDGSAAAPTAGLHFTHQLIQRLRERAIALATIVLHVGLDTFRPISEPDPRRHRIHREWYSVPPEVQGSIAATRERRGRIVAIGTTVVRTLETWAGTGEPEGWTDLFVLPGHHFRCVDALLTNFHLPRSSLLMLVSAFAGRERVLSAYADAIRLEYRFYSFGDAMLIL
jgi:S-adenosylmethionine:tRNA ribosyltransferase-isomerase